MITSRTMEDITEMEAVTAQDAENFVFKEFPKIPRFRNMIVTEKIDGTNAAIVVCEYGFGTHADGQPDGTSVVAGTTTDGHGMPEWEYLVFAQSRKRIITPGKSTDNFGFAGWVHENAAPLANLLGPGRHFGEWWGQGIQRGYGLDHKRFSLFDTERWMWINNSTETSSWSLDHNGLEIPRHLDVVPIVDQGEFNMDDIDSALARLEDTGSVAAKKATLTTTYHQPEGVVIYMPQARLSFKKTLEGDGGKYSN
jgi:hypothetical protein